MATKPTLVFVPGAWHAPSTWSKVTTNLEAQQYKCVAIELPSTKSNPEATFGQDVDAVREAIITETAEGRNVVVIVHSYGGAVGASAIKGFTQGSTLAPESDDRQSGAVVGLAYISTGFVQTGVSFIDMVGGSPPPSWKIDANGFAVIVVDARDLFYHDLPEEEGKQWVQKLRDHSLKSLMEGGEHAYSGWKDVPVWYLATSADHALPIEAQRFFVQSARHAGACVVLREVESSHSPMLSKPAEVAKFVEDAVEAFTG